MIRLMEFTFNYFWEDGNMQAYSFMNTHTHKPPPTSFSVTACCDAEWRLFVSPTDSH